MSVRSLRGSTAITRRVLLRGTVVLCVALVALQLPMPVLTAPLQAQSAPQATDPIARTLFEPELIMKHRRAINLTDEQRDAISRLIRDLQGQVVNLQWEMQEQTESLATELARPRVDLDRALDRMGRVMQTERKIKEAHLTLLVRIKNLLRPEQQDALRKLKDQ